MDRTVHVNIEAGFDEYSCRPVVGVEEAHCNLDRGLRAPNKHGHALDPIGTDMDGPASVRGAGSSTREDVHLDSLLIKRLEEGFGPMAEEVDQALSTTLGGSTSLDPLVLQRRTTRLFIKQLKSSENEGVETRNA